MTRMTTTRMRRKRWRNWKRLERRSCRGMKMKKISNKKPTAGKKKTTVGCHPYQASTSANFKES